MINQNDIERIYDSNVYTTDGEKIGSVGQVYLDEDGGAPEWVTVKTGLFGTKESFVPLDKASFNGDHLEVPFGKEQVKDAPRIDTDRDLGPDEEDELYTYYGLASNGGRHNGGAPGRDATRGRDDDYDTGHDTSGPNTDDAMTRSEERLVAGTRTEEAGRARLRKHVVTEQQQVSVPVTREEVTIEREPITDSNRGSAFDGPAISEEEHEVTLRAERPVVETEAVPVERVRLGKHAVTDEESVSGEVRKERIDFDGPGDRDRRS